MYPRNPFLELKHFHEQVLKSNILELEFGTLKFEEHKYV